MNSPVELLPYVTRRSIDRRTLLAATATGIASAALASFVQSAGATSDVTPSLAAMDQVLQAGLATGIPGIALAVEQRGELLFSGAVGVSSIEEEIPLRPTDKFRIYSITKTFTATIVLQLVEEGVLAFDDTVTTWLDEPAVARIPNIDQVTIRQLLNHTSGIYDFGDDNDTTFWDDAFLGPNADWAKVWTLLELLAYADGANHAPYFAPGEGVYYSNTNYLLLGMIIEKATGNDFGTELEERILTPLGLSDTSLATGANMPEGVVDGYQILEGKLVNVTEINLSWVWTAGGIVSTTADLLRFARATFRGELLSPASVMELFRFIPNPNSDLSFGSGLYQCGSPNGTLVGMDGGSAGFEAIMMWLPEEELTVVVLTNRAFGDGGTEELRDGAFGWALSG